jgi:hypothetical protein
MAKAHIDAPIVPKESAMRSISIALLGIALATPAVALDSQPLSKLPSEMTPAEIKANNAGLDRKRSQLHHMPQDRGDWFPRQQGACLPDHQDVEGSERARQ